MRRREFCRATILSGGVLLTGFENLDLFSQGAAKSTSLAKGLSAGSLVEFVNEGRVQMDQAFGSELDGRLYTNLSSIGRTGGASDAPITPTDRFYVRTRASRLLPAETSWNVAVEGLADQPNDWPIDALRGRARSMGSHVMECAGNTRAAHFGMISAGRWIGVPLSEVVKAARPRAGATRVLVSGFDQYAENSVTSIAGASWIFALDEIATTGAFLATALNERPLTPDHGAPIRLVVPGWYGCACIKWVNRISLLDDNAEATSQMLEYATRTHQNGAPELAKDFLPASIEHAAMPIRVEKRITGGQVYYLVTGLLWGGSGPVQRLGIRFNPEEEFVDVDSLPPQTGPWTVWSHEWRPKVPGLYTIRLAILSVAKQPKRLESGYYARSVEIHEV